MNTKQQAIEIVEAAMKMCENTRNDYETGAYNALDNVLDSLQSLPDPATGQTQSAGVWVKASEILPLSHNSNILIRYGDADKEIGGIALIKELIENGFNNVEWLDESIQKPSDTDELSAQMIKDIEAMADSNYAASEAIGFADWLLENHASFDGFGGWSGSKKIVPNVHGTSSLQLYEVYKGIERKKFDDRVIARRIVAIQTPPITDNDPDPIPSSPTSPEEAIGIWRRSFLGIYRALTHEPLEDGWKQHIKNICTKSANMEIDTMRWVKVESENDLPEYNDDEYLAEWKLFGRSTEERPDYITGSFISILWKWKVENRVVSLRYLHEPKPNQP